MRNYRRGEDKLAIRMINYISRFYRGVLSGGDTLVTIDQEVQITLRYLEIVKIRYRNSFEFDYNFPKEMIQAKTPKLILQPIVENSIMHGFLGKKSHGSLRIRGLQKKRQNGDYNHGQWVWNSFRGASQNHGRGAEKILSRRRIWPSQY